MVPTSPVIRTGGELSVHFEASSGTDHLDGYWPVVHNAFSIEA